MAFEASAPGGAHVSKAHTTVCLEHLWDLAATKTRQHRRRWRSVEACDQNVVCGCGDVCEHHPIGEFGRGQALDRPAVYLHQPAAAGALGRGLCLTNGSGVQIDGKDRLAQVFGPGL